MFFWQTHSCVSKGKLKPGKVKWPSDFTECIWHLLFITQVYSLLPFLDLGTELLGHTTCAYSALEDTCKHFYKMAVSVYMLNCCVWKCQLFFSLIETWYYQSSSFVVFWWYEVESHCGFNMLFFLWMSNEAEHLLQPAICMSFLWHPIFLPMRFLIFFLLICQNSFYILIFSP